MAQNWRAAASQELAMTGLIKENDNKRLDEYVFFHKIKTTKDLMRTYDPLTLDIKTFALPDIGLWFRPIRMMWYIQKARVALLLEC